MNRKLPPPQSPSIRSRFSAEPPVRAHRRLLWALAACVVLVGTNVSAQQPPPPAATSSEYKLKVAYIYNFTRYVSWPAQAFRNADAPLVIGVIGDDPFGKSLDLLAVKKKAQGRMIVVRRYPTLDDYRDCHILFVPASSSAQLRERVVQITKGLPVLVVGESPGFAQRGATISFFPDTNGTVGLAINVDAATGQNLQVSAKLLKIATIVNGQTYN